MKKYLLLLSIMPIWLVGFGQKKLDVASIKAMCGCYDVQFSFAETFSPDTGYQFHNNHSSGGLEYVFVVEETKNSIMLQHLLVIGDTMIIKHWRQDWLFENADLYQYSKNDTWKYQQLDAADVKGQWTQKVYQVDDGPRYEGSATWVHADNRDFWENTADAPLPRREFTMRSDYNVLKRRNRQEITAYGWVHEQDNDKILRNANDVVVAHEKGWNTYTQTTDSRCDVAKKWWSENAQYWADVRFVWKERFALKQTLSITMLVAEKLLYQRLFELGDRLKSESNYDSENARTEIRKVMNMHLNLDKSVAIK